MPDFIIFDQSIALKFEMPLELFISGEGKH